MKKVVSLGTLVAITLSASPSISQVYKNSIPEEIEIKLQIEKEELNYLIRSGVIKMSEPGIFQIEKFEYLDEILQKGGLLQQDSAAFSSECIDRGGL